MRGNLLLLPAAVLLVQCGGAKKDPSVVDHSHGTVEVEPISWTGYYSGTLPCASCPGIETSLWVRDDSTYVFHQKNLDRDSIPRGIVGHWSVTGEDLILGGQRPEAPMRWKKGQHGLDQLALDGSATAGAPQTLQKLADAIGDAIPRMRVTGTFTYVADAQSFRPCGATYNWPCVGGMDMGEEEGEPLITFTNLDLQKVYLKGVKQAGDPWLVEVVCTMGMGPAMEGDGADEYIFIEQVIGNAGERCP